MQRSWESCVKLLWQKLVANDKKMRIDLKVAQAISIKSHQSFIFGKEGFSIFSKCKKDVMGEYGQIFSILQKYALVNLFVITKGICNAFNKAKIHYTISDEAGDDCVRLPIQISCGPILTAELSVIGDDGHVLNRPVTIAYSIPDHVRENVLLFLNHLNMSYPGYKFCLGYDGSVIVCYDVCEKIMRMYHLNGMTTVAVDPDTVLMIAGE